MQVGICCDEAVTAVLYENPGSAIFPSVERKKFHENERGTDV